MITSADPAIFKSSNHAVTGGLSVKLALLATCSGGDCPSVFAEEDGVDVVVQGYPVPAAVAGISVPVGESLVRVPQSVLIEAAARLTKMAE